MWVEFAIFSGKSVIIKVCVCVCVCAHACARVCIWRTGCRLEDWLMKEKLPNPMKIGIPNEEESKVMRASRISCPSKFGQS